MTDVTAPGYGAGKRYKFRAPKKEEVAARQARAAEASGPAGARKAARNEVRESVANFYPDTELLAAAAAGDKDAIRRCRALYLCTYGKVWNAEDSDA